MAASITPKSEIRMITSISVGYGEVPTAYKDGKAGWALPGNRITFSEDVATKVAAQLDQVIRSNLRNSRTTLH